MIEKDELKKTIDCILSNNQSTIDTLAELNQRTLNVFLDTKVSQAIKQLDKILPPRELLDSIIPSETINSLNEITNSYNSFFKKLEIKNSILPAITNIQIDSLWNLSKSIETQMIVNLKKSFLEARYDSIIPIINQTINSNSILASDIGFVRSSSLCRSLRDELKYPWGVAGAINSINLSTAKDLSLDNNIRFLASEKQFVTEDENGSIDARGLNLIYSCKCILNSDNDELFSKSELINFASYIESTPMTALETQTGRKIKSLILEYYNKREHTISFDREEYYHCRSHKSNEMDFTFQEMLRAPHGLPWAGRFNHVGQSHYYFSDTQKGAETEVRKHLSSNDVLQTIKIKPKRSIALLDISTSIPKCNTFLNHLRFNLRDNDTSHMPKEYLIPCFIADCCIRIGFEGIKYYGSKEYNNYVTWGSDCFDYVSICS